MSSSRAGLCPAITCRFFPRRNCWIQTPITFSCWHGILPAKLWNNNMPIRRVAENSSFRSQRPQLSKGDSFLNSIYVDSRFNDEKRRQLLYEGQLFVYSPRPTALAFTDFAAEMIKDAFGKDD